MAYYGEEMAYEGDLLEGVPELFEDPFAKQFGPEVPQPLWTLAEARDRLRGMPGVKVPPVVRRNGDGAADAALGQTYVKHIEQQLAKEVKLPKQRQPPMLNDQSLFTLSACYGDITDLFYHSPTNRIGTYYSPESQRAASVLFEQFGKDNKKKGKGKPRASSPDSPLAEQQPESPREEGEVAGHQQLAIMRYYYYIAHGVSVDEVVEYKSEWMKHILSMTPGGPLPGLTQEFYDAFMKEGLKEIYDDYIFSVKKAIVDYAVSSKVERGRLNLQDIEKPYYNLAISKQRAKDEVVWRELPEEWYMLVDRAREEIAWTLQTLSANALDLSALWEEFSSQLLVDVESDLFAMDQPYTPDDFIQYQTEACDSSKNNLWQNWLPQCTDIFRQKPPICINGDSEAYFRSITTLQSNQIHTLVQDSLDSFVNYFEKHEPVDTVDPFGDNLLWSRPAVFKLKLTISNGTTVFEPSFQEVERTVGQVVDQFVTSVQGIPRIGANMSTSSRRVVHVPAVDLGDQSVAEAKRRVVAALRSNVNAPNALMAMFDEYLYMITMNVAGYLAEFKQAGHDLEEYAEAIAKYQQAAEEIENKCTDSVRTGLFSIECSECKQVLSEAASNITNGLLTQIRQSVYNDNKMICESYATMSVDVAKVCTTSEDVLELKARIQKCTADQEQLLEVIKENKSKEEFLHQYRHQIPESDFTLAMRAYEWPKKMIDIMKEAISKANKEHRSFEDALKKRRSAFSQTLMQHEEVIGTYKEWSDVVKRSDFSKKVLEMQGLLQSAQDEADEINRLEKLFGWQSTKFEKILVLTQALDPYLVLWTTVHTFYTNYAEWMNGPFSRINPEDVENDALDMFRKIYKLSKFFNGATGHDPVEAAAGVAESTVAKIKSFQEHIPLISAICNRGLRERHWQKLSDLVGFEFKSDDHTSFNRLLDRQINDHKNEIQEISDHASREWTLERTLDKMEVDWSELHFELADWKDTGTYILKGGPVDEAQTLLDDHIVKSQAMSASPFATPFADRIGPWEKKLVLLQDILDEWLKCQSKWIYLEPIFGSEEIMKQIPKEGAAFREMDLIWRDIMQKVKAQTHIITVAGFHNLLGDLQSANEQLDVVEKGLNAFLDTKKMAFPRFFFLSNDELLEILSEGKIPKNVQPFVKKCFESMKDLNFNDEQGGVIDAMNSVEGEQVPFPTPIDPVAVGAVEKWLDMVEDQMRQALLKVAGQAIEAYADTPREKWIFEWPGQLVLNCSQVYWTTETTDAIKEGGSKGLGEYAEKCTAQLMKLVDAVRGQLTKLERMTAGALCVIDVHARDVLAEMARDGVERDDDFKWLSQLRYYWEHDEKRWKQDTLVVRMINAVAYYGYEYYGNSGRLVITPLTDRCYRTLMGAIHLNFGGAPAGPAGTGKTETTKDLAKALAIQCVVFNCSDSLDYKAMGKFFKGLACSGAWACFDEFNRIELEVLSVVAQQVLTIQRAVAANVKTFVFEGIELRLVPTCNVFITMNPGYAGRSELPDNLKALFRDVAMMVPDYAMIAEIILYSNGYLEARPMSRKLVQTYRLCSEQLSSQDHYDYGMRAVIAVLRAAGNLKRKFTEEKEDILMLRAILDVNVPKFLDQDVPLFNGILSDLFPGVELPAMDYDSFKAALTENCEKMNLQPLDSFFNKITQLYEMIIVRHGLMVVGESYGMKTCMYKVLSGALTDLCGKGLMGEKVVKYYVLNPKSVTMGQLYGQEDPVSKEWTDGVLAVTFRNAARDTSDIRKWIMLDGPVDAIWIENMNTVLDDNKKLCLNSGEIVAMSGLMNMIFEVQDLAVASPATVSRCGMVYVQESLLGWKPPVQSWIKTLPPGITDVHKEQIMALFEWLLPPCLRVVTKKCSMPLPMQETNLAFSLMRLYESLLDEFQEPEKIAEMNENLVMCWVQCLFMFSLVWAVGASVGPEGREHFNKMLRKLLINDAPKSLQIYITAPNVKLTQLFPEARTVFDYKFDKGKGKWALWLDTVEKQTIDPESEYTEIIVQTVDTIRYTFILNALLTHGHHSMFVGPTGTGKSVYIKNLLQNGMDKEKYTFALMNFSAQTTANMTQDIVDGKLDKRRKGIYGPPVGKKMFIFVDDINMPQVETYGAQPPIELLRQWMDHKGWYDRRELTFRQLVDIQFVAAMGPPGGGRNGITNRYARHFSVLSVTEFETDTLNLIFSVLMDWWVKKFEYGDTIAKKTKAIVLASISTYKRAQADLLPTPTKSHYTFNLRDVSKVFQGVVTAGKHVEDPCSLMRLWVHETLRVYHDRLIDDADREYFINMTGEVLEDATKDKFGKLMTPTGAAKKMEVPESAFLVFGDFMVPGADPKIYKEVADAARFLDVTQEYLADYNAISKKPLPLVLFRYALEHTSRVCRIINRPGGHSLLVGLGGSGRKSLARLAAAMEEFEVFQIELSKTYSSTEWYDDLRMVLKMAGEQNKRVVFLFSDVQIKWEGMVEDVSNLLNTYEVPNLFSGGDLATIFENIRPRAKQVGLDKSKQDLYAFFLNEIKRNFHIVLTMSPVGGDFRERLRKFPALVNCTTIDWFSAWPQDALSTVAKDILKDLPVTPDVLDSVVKLCVFFHATVQKLATKFLQSERRHYYVTPTSYLELLSSFQGLLAKRQDEVKALKTRYEVGLTKLNDTESSLQGMQQELVELQPKLIESSKETEQAMEIIAVETEAADKVKVVVQADEAKASAEASAVQAIKDECEHDLAVAMPLLESALKALDTLTKNDITEIKMMKSPPQPVRLVMEAVCVLKGVKAARKKDEASGKMVDDYWDAAKKMCMESNFLNSLREYDKDNIPEKIINKIKPYVENPDFDPEKIKNASKAAFGLCCWVRAMEAYDRVAKVVAPKRAKLAQAEKDLEVVMGALAVKQAELKEVLDKLAALDADLQEKKAKKQKLEEDVEMCTVKLDRAQKLISGLGGEKVRWSQAAVDLGEQYVKLTGDVLLASAQIAYLGPFTATYRQEAIVQWVEKCKEYEVPCSDVFSLNAVLGDPVKIRAWNIQGLPKDEFSAENAIAMDQGSRWPLCIDPQGLTNKWIRTMEADNKLKVVKLTDPDYMRSLENCIAFGTPTLIENIQESIDGTLEPLLQKEIFKQAGAYCIKLGDTVVEYSDKFKLYMTTKLRNPHYPPEICVAVNLLNFMTTPEGLEDQLLGIVVAKERPDLEEEKSKLIIQGAENKRKLQEIEDQILKTLSASEGNILEDKAAVEILQQAKITSDDISEKQKIADVTEEKIDEARKGYKPVAFHSTVLFFCVADMANIDPMYQYSLQWFTNLFQRAINDSAKSDQLEVRLKSLADHFTYFLFQMVCRSLFEKDKLLFAFHLASKLQIANGELDAARLRFLLTGGVAVGDIEKANPDPSWISEKMWTEMVLLSDMEGFEGYCDSVTADPAPWKVVYDSAVPQAEAYPDPWDENTDPFAKLMVLRTLRVDKLIPALTRFVEAVMGKRFVEPQPFALEPSFNESDSCTPLLFVLSAGADPMAALLKFADDRSIRVEAVSLGQGQGPIAEKWIQQGTKEGFWVVLQNCHLAKSFLPTLEIITEKDLQPDLVHKEFRLWLTSYPSPIFPISILENGVKMTTEAPKGLRAGMLRIYASDPVSDQEFFNSSTKDAAWRKMMFGLAFFHSVLNERRKFGAIGFNIPYQFNENDLRISVRQLKMFLDEYEEIPYDTLQYTCGECNYGGKVTDGHDRHTMMTLLNDYYNAELALGEDYKLSPSGKYLVPPHGAYKSYIEAINKVPLIVEPEVFGLHENATISKDIKETDEMLESLMLTQSSSGGGGGDSFESVIDGVCTEVLGKWPKDFDIEAAFRKYPQDYHNSMNTVLVQEMGRYNRLLVVVRASLVNLGKALKGLALMSDELEVVSKSMFVGKIPPPWLKKSFPSLKPLAGYVKETVERCSFFDDWVDHGQPKINWLPGFFFTQAFLTASKQNFARKYTVEIDKVDFDYFVRDAEEPDLPEDGILVNGIMLEGCKWDYAAHCLTESDPKVLFTKFPTMHMLPMKTTEFHEFRHYSCPMYKTPDRRGILSTTGHSTNFVMDARIPIGEDSTPAHWTKRGVAMLLSLLD